MGVLRARLIAVSVMSLLAGAALAQSSLQLNYTLFESGPVRPLALSADGTKLFACNIPDGRLEIFDVSPSGLVHSGSVQVGVDPVAVAESPDGKVWVVNHMSDSISIVDVPALDASKARVVRTLLVGDEPRDIVFGGVGRNRAFITAAHRGQNRPATQSDPNLPNVPDPNDPFELFKPGIGRADVWVFNVTNLGPDTSLGGDEIAILPLFGDTPRALAVSPDGLTVYAAVFHSGNQTTTVSKGVVDTPGPLLDAPMPTGPPLPAPLVGVMLKQVGPTTWQGVGPDFLEYNGKVRFSLPDHDVFAIDADATVLDSTAITATIDHVGTVLFNMVVHPTTPGLLYVSNTDANNMDRLEGSGATTLRGELHHAQISWISGGVAHQRRLNPHITYTDLNPAQSINDRSLAIPTDMAITSDGTKLYVAAFGSQKIGIVNTAALVPEPDPNDPNAFMPALDESDHIQLSGGGPGGVVLNAANTRLYVLTRFDNTISVVNTATRLEMARIPIHTPEGAAITQGRRFFYDARFSSSNGEASCASCHIFGDFDSLAWDLGNGDPNAAGAFNNNPFVRLNAPVSGFALAGPALNLLADLFGTAHVVAGNLDFHPFKGPMTTQTLRGMEHGGPMHWRGDRSGGTGPTSVQVSPGFDGAPGALDATKAFKAFNPAFVGLLGKQTQISDVDPNGCSDDCSDMTKFTKFILQVQLPPNPIRSLDRALTTSQQAGATFFGTSATVPATAGPISDTLKDCNGCHTLNPSLGFFGTGGLSTFEAETQHFKVAHLRNAYQKVGMFGQSGLAGGDPSANQVRGFGLLHDGSIDSVMTFLGSGNPNSVFQFPGGDPQRRQVADFVLAFDSDLAPMVGQQVTLTAANKTDVDVVARLGKLIASAGTLYTDPDHPAGSKECDLVVKGRNAITLKQRGWWMSSSGPAAFTPDEGSDSSPPATLTDAALLALANTSDQELTYTCVPPGSGKRLGIDRGGVGDASQPDGIYDFSQCGDVNYDGVDTGDDVARMRAWLADPGAPFAVAKCNVNGANGSSAAECDIADVTALRHAIVGPGPTLTQGCVL